MSSTKKDVEAVIAAAKAQGWRHCLTANNHHQLLSPDRKTIVVGSGQSTDPRAFDNFMTKMRAGGYVECDAQSATQSLGDALRAAKAAAPQLEELSVPAAPQRLTLEQIVTGFIGRRGAACSTSDIALVVKHHRPSVQHQSILSQLSQLAARGKIRRITAGLYDLPLTAPAVPVVVDGAEQKSSQQATGDALARATDRVMHAALPKSDEEILSALQNKISLPEALQQMNDEELAGELLALQSAVIAALGRIERVVQQLRARAQAK